MTLPISVIIPIKDCIHLLVRHVSLNKTWIPHVAEIIVVDSYSKDGSIEFLKKKLPHPNIRFISHPPGLYQSWNFGIQKAKHPYIYISTAGESITLEGLIHLLDSIQKLDCDVIVSPPKFEKEGTGRISTRPWPVREIVELFNITEPAVIPQKILFDFMIYYLRSAILGSSASNLYKSSTLKKYPFPEDYGTCGDSAWGIRYNYKVSIGFTPRVFSSFLFHKKENVKIKSTGPNKDLKELFLKLVYDSINSELEASPPSLSQQFSSKFELLDIQKEIVKHKVLYKEYRDKSLLLSYGALNAIVYRLNHKRLRKKFKNRVVQLAENYIHRTKVKI